MIFGVGFWTDVHPATVGLGLAAGLFIAVLGFVLSPGGRPAPPGRRAGGFSRAMADRSEGEGGGR